MGSNEPKRPNSFKRLKQLIDRQTIRLSDTAKAKTFRKNFIAGVLGQMIPDGAYLKGGSAISLRYPLSESRVSRDIDTAYSGSEEEFEESFAKKLQEGWQGFAGSFEHAERKHTPAGIQLDTLSVHLDYMGIRFATINFEASPDLGDHLPDAEYRMDNDMREIFQSMGFDMAPARMMDIDAQLAEKLNGLSRENRNGKDLYDIETIMRHHTPDLGLLRDNSRIAERRDQGHDTKIIPDSKKAEYLATYTRAGGRNKEQCWTLAQRLLSEVDLDCSDEWHEYWERMRRFWRTLLILLKPSKLKLIGFAVSRCVLQPSGLPPACRNRVGRFMSIRTGKRMAPLCGDTIGDVRAKSGVQSACR